LYRTVFEGRMSRADFWSWSAMWAIEKTVDNNNKWCQEENCMISEPNFLYNWGRIDCPTSPKTPPTKSGENLPTAKFSNSQTLNYFNEVFHMSPRETVALMGAHTLGQARIQNSGFNGTWVTGEGTMFNNKFYKLMVDESLCWEHKDISNTEKNRWQFYAKDKAKNRKGFMLTSDFSLYKDFFSLDNGQAACHISTEMGCKLASTSEIVKRFAADQEAWFREFRLAYMKMLNNGYGDNGDGLIPISSY